MVKTHSPIKEPPLRVPGQSIQREIYRVLIDELFVISFVIAFAVIWPTYEWFRWLTKASPSPWLATVLAIFALIYGFLRLISVKGRLEALKLGIEGERAVAEELDRLKSTGAIVFHDIVASSFNIDHVVLSKQGIYAVETKAFSKAPGGEVSFDGTTLLINGRTPKKDPIVQAVAAADWIKSTLKTMTTKDYPVRPVLVFPGWYVNPVSEHHGARVWVLNPKALPAFIANEPKAVSEDDLRFAVFFLARYIRTTPDAA